MKAKFPWAILALTLAVPDVNAQWHVGGVIDLNRSNIAVDPEPELGGYSSRLRFGIGAVVDYALSSRIDLHSQLMVQGKGATIEELEDDEVQWSTSWVEIPIQVRYTFRSNAPVRPFIAAGPSFGFLRSARFEFVDYPDEEDEEAKSFDAGLAISAGASMPQGKGTLFGSLRYVHGLVNVIDVDSDLKVMNRGLQVLVGMTFPIGKK